MKSFLDNWDIVLNISIWLGKGDNIFGKLLKLKFLSCRKVIIKNWRG